jgi:hypothetical protein
MRALMLRLLLGLGLAGCAHVPPASLAGVPDPWPATSPSLVQKTGEIPAVPAPGSKKPPIPPLRQDVLPPPTPAPPRMDPSP